VEQGPKSDVRYAKARNPLGFLYFALGLFMVVYFIRPQDWIPGLSSVPFAKITGIIMLLALGFSFPNISRHVPQEVALLSLLLLQLWLAAAFSPIWKGGAINAMLEFSKALLVVIVIFAAVRSMKQLHWVLFMQAASMAIIAISSIVAAKVAAGRLQGVTGLYGNSNDLALSIDLSLPLCLALALSTKSYWNKFAWTMAMLAMIYAVVLTASRGGAIALVVAVMVCVWQLGVRERRFYLLLLVPVVMVGIWLYSGTALEQRFEQTNIDSATGGRATEASGSVEQRRQLLNQSLRVTAQHPFFGVGPGNFVIMSGMWRVSHNSYTQVSAEGGVAAFVLYLLILWRAVSNLRAVRRYRKAEKQTRLFSMALEATLSAYLVGSFFASVAYQMFPYFLVAYTGVLRLLVQRKRTKSTLPAETNSAPAEIEVTVWR